MSEKIYKVFVSSTYDDLRRERAEVQRALLQLNCMPLGMELFPAADEETWEFIKKQISEADYYLLIIGGRYGSLAPDGTSFTEKEYNFAIEIQKPSIAFVADEDELDGKRIDKDPDQRRKLEAFRLKVRLRPIRFFKNAHELASEVTTSMVRLLNSRPAVGYMRSDAVADPKKYADALERIRELETVLASGPVNEAVAVLGWLTGDMTVTIHVSNSQHTVSQDKASLFAEVADQILLGASIELRLAWNIAKWLIRKHKVNVPDTTNASVDLTPIKRLFFTLGLIKARQQPGLDMEWTITDLGRSVLLKLSVAPE